MIVIVILILANAYIFMNTGKASTQAAPGEKGWTVFGTMGCGWTRKQLEHMKKVNKPFTFVDCDKGKCDGMDAYPVIVAPDGEKHVGFKEV